VQLHAAIAWILAGLIALHIAGVLLTSWQHRENLATAMITGNKAPLANGDVE
jgi:cytochrome b